MAAQLHHADAILSATAHVVLMSDDHHCAHHIVPRGLNLHGISGDEVLLLVCSPFIFCPLVFELIAHGQTIHFSESLG